MSRVGVVVLAAAVVVVGVIALAQLFVARDDADVSSPATSAPGSLEPDRGATHRDTAASDPAARPTSGPHRPDPVTREARALTADQVLHALELGNVVLLHPGPRPPAELRALQAEVAGPFDAELAAAGQAVILARGSPSGRVEALAWRRRLVASGPDDPGLREFAEAWLGRGAD